MAYKLAEAFVEISERGLNNVLGRIGSLNNQLGVLDGILGKVGTSFTGFSALGVGAIGALSVAIGTKAITAVSQLEDALAEVSTLVDTNEVSMKQMESAVIAMSTRVYKSSVELSNGLYQVISAGVDAGDSLSFLELSAKAAAAGLTDTFTAVDLITTVLNAFSLEVSEAEHVSDLLFGTAKEGKTRFNELAGSLGRLLPIASDLKVPLDELLGIIAHLTKGGLSTSESVTALRSAMMEFVKPAESVNKVLGSQSDLMSSSAVRSKGLIRAFNDLRIEAERNGIQISDLIGRQEALIAISRTTGDQMDLVAQSIRDVGDSVGETDAAFEKITGTLSQQTKLAGLELQKSWLGLGKVLKVPVSGAVLTVTNFVRGLNLTISKSIGLVNSYRAAMQGLIDWTTGAFKEMEQVSLRVELPPLKPEEEQEIKQALGPPALGREETEKRAKRREELNEAIRRATLQLAEMEAKTFVDTEERELESLKARYDSRQSNIDKQIQAFQEGTEKEIELVSQLNKQKLALESGYQRERQEIIERYTEERDALLEEGIGFGAKVLSEESKLLRFAVRNRLAELEWEKDEEEKIRKAALKDKVKQLDLGVKIALASQKLELKYQKQFAESAVKIAHEKVKMIDKSEDWLAKERRRNIDESLRAYDTLSRKTRDFERTVGDVMVGWSEITKDIDISHWSDSLKDVSFSFDVIYDSLNALGVELDDTTKSAMRFAGALMIGDPFSAAISGLGLLKNMFDSMTGPGFGGLELDVEDVPGSIEKIQKKIEGLKVDVQTAQQVGLFGYVNIIENQIAEYEKALMILESRLEKGETVKTIGLIGDTLASNLATGLKSGLSAIDIGEDVEKILKEQLFDRALEVIISNMPLLEKGMQKWADLVQDALSEASKGGVTITEWELGFIEQAGQELKWMFEGAAEDGKALFDTLGLIIDDEGMNVTKKLSVLGDKLATSLSSGLRSGLLAIDIGKDIEQILKEQLFNRALEVIISNMPLLEKGIQRWGDLVQDALSEVSEKGIKITPFEFELIEQAGQELKWMFEGAAEDGKQLLDTLGLTVDETKKLKTEAGKRITGGITISQITGPTRDILVSTLSPLKQLNTTFPAMLDEMKTQTVLLSGISGMPLEQIRGGFPINDIDGFGNDIVKQLNTTFPAMLDEMEIQTALLSGISGMPSRDILVSTLSPLKQLNTTFPAMLDEMKTQTVLLSGISGMPLEQIRGSSPINDIDGLGSGIVVEGDIIINVTEESDLTSESINTLLQREVAISRRKRGAA